MPRQTVQIDAYGKNSEAWAFAQLMSYVAYPSGLDSSRQRLFARSLYRMALIWRAEKDKGWASSYQQMLPFALLDDEKTFLTSLKRGQKQFWRHLVTAHAFLLPHLIGVDTDALPDLDRLYPKSKSALKAPTVENMSLIVMEAIGWNGDSSSTVKSKLWSAVKPVSHLGYAIAGQISSEVSVIKDRKGDVFDALCGLFFNESAIICVAVAERCRLKLPLIRQFKIDESETIQFVLSRTG